ncbi:hypothetical protein HDV00_005900 [Rhizophlyctis rosea]|nr:hypothetical protein HDV00_005900 [Rhizophlyctis rosea]
MCEIVFSSLNWYVHSLRKMHLDNGWDWAMVRNDKMVSDVWDYAKSLEAIAKKEKGETPLKEDGKPKKKRGKPYSKDNADDDVKEPLAKKGRKGSSDAAPSGRPTLPPNTFPPIAPRPSLTSILPTPALTPATSPPGSKGSGRGENGLVLPTIAQSGLKTEPWDLNSRSQPYQPPFALPRPSPTASNSGFTPANISCTLPVNQTHFPQASAPTPTPVSRHPRVNMNNLDDIVIASLRNIEEYRNSQSCAPARRQRIDSLLSFLLQPTPATTAAALEVSQQAAPAVQSVVQRESHAGPANGGNRGLLLPNMVSSSRTELTSTTTAYDIPGTPAVDSPRAHTSNPQASNSILPLPLPHDPSAVFTADASQLDPHDGEMLEAETPPPEVEMLEAVTPPPDSQQTSVSAPPQQQKKPPTPITTPEEVHPAILANALASVTQPKRPSPPVPTPVIVEATPSTSVEYSSTPCSGCRKLKIKCDRVRPSCGPCVKRSAKKGVEVVCAWPEDVVVVREEVARGGVDGMDEDGGGDVEVKVLPITPESVVTKERGEGTEEDEEVHEDRMDVDGEERNGRDESGSERGSGSESGSESGGASGGGSGSGEAEGSRNGDDEDTNSGDEMQED